jgi:hypothetical protein
VAAILHLDPASRPRDLAGKAMPFASLTFLRSGTDQIIETHTADSAGEFSTIAPDFDAYTYRVQLRDQDGRLRYDVPAYKAAYPNYVDAQSQRIVTDEIVPGTEFAFRATAGGALVNLYADAELTAPLPNPLKTDASGLLPPIYKASGAYYMESGAVSVYFAGEAYPLEIALSGTASPAAATVSATTAAITTDSITVIPVGGEGPYLYSWVWQTGGASITITSASTASTTFSSSGLSLPQTRTGTARCTITDSAGATATVDVAVSITRTATPGTLDSSASPSSITLVDPAVDITTVSIGVTPTGGTAPYTYAWTWQSGGTGITINTATAVATTLTASVMALAQVRTGTLRCTVTDASLATDTVDVAISITRGSAFTVGTSATDLNTEFSSSGDWTSPSVTATPVGGTASFTYSWAWTSGGASLTINSPTASTTTVTAPSISYPDDPRSGTLQCTVTDSNGFVAVSNEVSVDFYGFGA